jgi:hypothetical protein
LPALENFDGGSLDVTEKSLWLLTG